MCFVVILMVFTGKVDAPVFLTFTKLFYTLKWGGVGSTPTSSEPFSFNLHMANKSFNAKYR